MTGFGTDHADSKKLCVKQHTCIFLLFVSTNLTPFTPLLSAPIYLIYYTASTINYFSSAKKNIIETFINGVSSTSYWNIVRQYYYQAPSPPNLKYYIGGIYKYTSITVFCDSNSYAVGCNLGQSDLVTLVTNVVAKGKISIFFLSHFTTCSIYSLTTFYKKEHCPIPL